MKSFLALFILLAIVNNAHSDMFSQDKEKMIGHWKCIATPKNPKDKIVFRDGILNLNKNGDIQFKKTFTLHSELKYSWTYKGKYSIGEQNYKGFHLDYTARIIDVTTEHNRPNKLPNDYISSIDSIMTKTPSDEVSAFLFIKKANDGELEFITAETLDIVNQWNCKRISK